MSTVTTSRTAAPLPAGASTLSTSVLALIGLACAICVASNYFSQPLLLAITGDLGMPKSLAGLVPTLTQAGIAAGMLLLLPLGDRTDNRRLVTTLLSIQAVALTIMALTPVALPFLVACLIAGLCGIVTYLLPAYATRLVAPARRGTVTGLLATGILTGIMLGRSVAGIAGFEIGWRAVYGAGAFGTALMAAVMLRSMPDTPGLLRESYLRLLASLWPLWRQHRLLRRATLLQALSFGTFNALWVGLTLHLQQVPFALNTREIGELSLVAVTSAIAAPVIGRMADRHQWQMVVVASFVAIIGGWAALLIWPFSYVSVVTGMVAVGLGAIGTDVTLRTSLYGLDPAIRMRLNAVYSAGTFIGGSTFSLLTPLLWYRWGWASVSAFAIIASVLALVATMIFARLDREQE